MRSRSAIGVQAPEELHQAGTISSAHFGEFDAESACFFRKAHDALHADFSFVQGKEHLDDGTDRHRVARGNEHAAGAQIPDAGYDARPASRPRDPYSLRHGNAGIAAVIFGDFFGHLFFERAEAQRRAGWTKQGDPLEEMLDFVCTQCSQPACARLEHSGERRPQVPTALTIAH